MISIVIPAYNEGEAIRGTVGTILAMVERESLEAAEVLVVDDGSGDGTAEAAEAAGATVVRHPINVGYGRALKTGILAARHDTVVILDADLTYPADSIPALLEEYRKGFDMVVGARQGEHVNPTPFKGPLRRILKAMVEFVAERPIPDVNSGLRVFSKETIRGYLDHLCDTFSFTTSLTLAYVLTGRFVGYLAIPYHARVGETKVRMLGDSMKTLQYIVQSVIYYNPLKLFVLVSGLLIGFSAVSFLVGAVSHLNIFYYLGIIGILMSFLSFGTGLLADLLRQILAK
jgi:glycosyltransferase involved in cell wall biosynthesis